MKVFEFLLKRPISVCMTFFALCVLGIIGYNLLPVSLLPNIPIPEIVIQVNAPGRSAKEIDELAISPIRQQLLTVDDLESVTCRSTDNHGTIILRFGYNSPLNLALININEKVYKVTENLPEDFETPNVSKSNATDIPVEYIYMTLKNDLPNGETNPVDFISMSEVCENVIRRRIEQLPEVAMVDVSGLMYKELQVLPDQDYIANAGITTDDMRLAIKACNVRPVSMRVRDGVFRYTIHMENSLSTLDDLADVSISKNGRTYRLGDICKLQVSPQDESGFSLYKGKRCISMRVVKKHEGKVKDLKKEIEHSLNVFRKQYPEIEFQESRDQTNILNYSIVTLKQNFLLSLGLMFLIAFIFMGDVKTPLVTAVSMTVALIICFLAFYLFKMSLNILSLSGLILVVGMMIDNILITSENILRHEHSGEGVIRSCSLGCAEMVTPMLSSTLTTIVVFIPLLFLSDLAGALFFDQAVAISIGLLVSYFISLLLLPVLFMLFGKADKLVPRQYRQRRLSDRLSEWMFRVYDRVIDITDRHRTVVFICVILTIPLCYVAFKLLPKSQMPATDNKEMIFRITWDSGLPLEENARRANQLIREFSTKTEEVSASVGTQSFVLDGSNILASNQVELYLKTASPRHLDNCLKELGEYVERNYPGATYKTSATENIFDRLFTSESAPIEVKVYTNNPGSPQFLRDIETVSNLIEKETGIAVEPPEMQKELRLTLNTKAMEAYNVSYDAVYNEIESAFRDVQLSNIGSTTYIPIVLKGEYADLDTYLANGTVMSTDRKNSVPLFYLVELEYVDGLVELKADKNGTMYPIKLFPADDAESVSDRLRHDLLPLLSDIRTDIAGALTEEANTFTSLFWIFVLSLVLMYFILCAQFESFLQPLVVLAEIPIDVCFAMFTLLLCGYSFNIMSGIGIIASCGIIINDSILKIDAINKLIADGMPINEAIHTAGKLRIRPIVMTSLTTIIGMLPFFMTSDLGSELQQPLALGMVAALVIGTPVSLFVVPVLFESIILRRKKGIKAKVTA